jgi:hypothetical protein
MHCLLEQVSEFSPLKSEICDMKLAAERIAKQLYGWIEQLKNAGITGQRHLNDNTRTRTAAKKDQDTFLEELNRIRQADPKTI